MDFVPLHGRLAFPAYVQSKTFVVDVLNDNVFEYPNEQVGRRRDRRGEGDVLLPMFDSPHWWATAIATAGHPPLSPSLLPHSMQVQLRLFDTRFSQAVQQGGGEIFCSDYVTAGAVTLPHCVMGTNAARLLQPTDVLVIEGEMYSVTSVVIAHALHLRVLYCLLYGKWVFFILPPSSLSHTPTPVLFLPTFHCPGQQPHGGLPAPLRWP